MRTIISSMLLSLLVAVTGVVKAESRFDPAALAKTVAPFIEPQTIAVVHFDLSRLAVEPTMVQMQQWFPQHKNEIAAIGAPIAKQCGAARRAGAKDLYFIYSMRDLPIPGDALAVITLEPTADEKAVIAALASPKDKVERRDRMLLIGPKAMMDRMHDAKPEPRPDLARAFEAAGDTPFQAILTLPSYTARVVEETMPTLPTAIGGGPSTILTRGIVWAVVSVDLPPHPAVRLVIQSADQPSAEAMRTKWSEMIGMLGKNEQFRRDLPQFEPIARLFLPEAKGGRLTIALSESKGLPTLIEQLNRAAQPAGK